MADNASITILRNTQANINAEPIKDGNILFTTDQAENKIYADVGTKRIKIGGAVDVDTTLSTTSTNPVQNKVITNSVNDVRGQICTNLLNPTAQTQTINGVTLTNNGDGTYTVNGTASGQAVFPLMTFNDFALLENKKLIGCPAGGSSSTYQLYINCSSSIWLKEYNEYGNGVIISNIPSEATSITLYIFVRDGQTVNNLVFKPMLTTDLSADYDSFVKYSGSEERLNEQVASLHESSKGVITNLLNPTAQTQTVNGVTFTNNGDGTYTVNGTASKDTRIRLTNSNINITNPSVFQNSKLVGCPKGGSARTYNLYIDLYHNATWVMDYCDIGNGIIVSNIPSNVNGLRPTFMIGKGTTVNNLTFKPMLTTDLNATYDDFVPYTGDSGRLNEDVAKIKEKINAKASVLDCYPVGAIYMSMSPTSPAQLFGGTWEQLKDRFLLATGDTYKAGSTGGEAQHTLTTDEMPSHHHDLKDVVVNDTMQHGNKINVGAGSGIVSYSTETGLYYTSNTGENKPHNNMPPYLTVYMWRRTA